MNKTRWVLASLFIGGLAFFAGSSTGRLQLYRVLYISGHRPAQIWAAEAMRGEDPSAALPVIFELIEEGDLPVSLIPYDAAPCFPEPYAPLDPPLQELPGEAPLLKVALGFCQAPEARGQTLDPSFADTPLLEDPALLAAWIAAADHPDAALRDQLVFALAAACSAVNPRRDPVLTRDIRRALTRFATEDPVPEIRGRALRFFDRRRAEVDFFLLRLDVDPSLELRRFVLQLLYQRLWQHPEDFRDEQKDALSADLVAVWAEEARLALVEAGPGGLSYAMVDKDHRRLLTSHFIIDQGGADLPLLHWVRDHPGPIAALLIENLSWYPSSPLAEADRAAALAVLGSSEDPKVIKAIVAYLLSSKSETIPSLFARGEADLTGADPKRRRRGASTLGSLLDGASKAQETFDAAGLKERFVNRLRPGLADPDPQLRRRCAEALATLFPPEPLRALFQTLRDDPDPEVQLIAARSLANLRENPDPSAAPLLFEALAEDRRRRQQLLKGAAKTHRWSLADIPDLKLGEGRRAIGARCGLENLGPAIIPALLGEIRKARPRHRDRLLVTLASLRGLGTRALELACGGKDDLARRARALSKSEQGQ